MNKALLPILLLMMVFLYPSLLFSQSIIDQVDSLQKTLQNEDLHDTVKVINLITAAHLLNTSGDNDSLSIEIANRALDFSKSIDYSRGEASALTSLGVSYYHKLDYSKAIKYYRESMLTKAAQSDEGFKHTTGVNLSLIHLELMNLDRARELLENARIYFESVDNLELLIIIWNNLGLLEREAKNYSKSLQWFQKAIEETRETGDLVAYIPTLQSNIGYVLHLQESYKEAELYLDSALANETALSFMNIMYARSGLAQIYYTTGRYSEALDLSEELITLAESVPLVPFLSDLYMLRSQALEKLGRLEDAIHDFKAHAMWKDSLANDEKRMDVLRGDLELEHAYEKGQIAAKYEAEAEVQALKSRQQAYLMGGSLILILFASISGITIMRNRKRRKEAELLIKISDEENKALRAQLKPHFIFNSINSAVEYLRNNSKEKAEGFLVKFSSLIRKVLDASNKKEITLEEDLDILERYINLEAERANHAFTYSIKTDGNLDLSNVLVPSLIYQPFIENSILHGVKGVQDGKIFIRFRVEDDVLICDIEDNGVGRKATMKQKADTNKTSLGVSLSSRRIEDLEDHKSKDFGVTYRDLEIGTKVIVRMPLALKF